MVIKKQKKLDGQDDEDASGMVAAQDLQWKMKWEELHGMSKTIETLKLKVQGGKPLSSEIRSFLLHGGAEWSMNCQLRIQGYVVLNALLITISFPFTGSTPSHP